MEVKPLKLNDIDARALALEKGLRWPYCGGRRGRDGYNSNDNAFNYCGRVVENESPRSLGFIHEVRGE
jgi:hypothetical protein